MEGSRDSRFEALGFFIVSAIGQFRDDATCKAHLNKSRVEQRLLSAHLGRGELEEDL